MAASKARLGYGSKFYTGDTRVRSVTRFSPKSRSSTSPTTRWPRSMLRTCSRPIQAKSQSWSSEARHNRTDRELYGDASQQNIDVLAVAQTVFPWKITAPASGALVLTITGFGYITKKETGPFEANKKNDFKVAVRVSGAISYSVA